MIWRTFLNLSRAPKRVFSNNDTKPLSLRDNHCCPFFIYLGITINLLSKDVKNLTSILNFSRAPKCFFSSMQLINLLSEDVKNLTSIMSYSIVPKCVSCNDNTNALFLWELQFSLIFTSWPLNHQRTNKQLITLRFNDAKSLSSVLSHCIGPKCVSCNDDTKAKFSCELHFSLIFTRRPINLQLTNKQPINLLYSDAKSLSSILSFCICPKCVSSNDDTKALTLCELHFSLFLQVDI